MKTITVKQAKDLKTKWEKKLQNISHMGQVDYNELKKDGFEFCIIGTGKTSYTRSKRIAIQDVITHRDWYLKGKHLVIGVCNMARGKGVQYRGWCLKIN